MIHSRILELLKTPEKFSENDFPILESEIGKYPYIQNIKALYLYGTHQFRPENYAALLSKTAAYTTDKKILYQFINKNKIEEKSVENIISVPENPMAKDDFKESETPKMETEETCEIPQVELLKPVFVNGERNRILFEGEENFLEHSSEKLDSEEKIEAENSFNSKLKIEENKALNEVSENEIVVSEEQVLEEKTEIPENNIEESNEVSLHETQEFLPKSDSEIIENEISENKFEEIPEAEDFSKEEIINETTILEEEKIVENSAEVSFHGTEDFMPNIQLKPKSSSENYQVPKAETNRHEEEMKKLLAEVEAKMKANKKAKPKVEEEEIQQNFDINFAETHDKIQPEIAEKDSEIKEEIVETQIQENPKTEENNSWKPMNFDNNLPDSVLNKIDEKPLEKVEKTVVSNENSDKTEENREIEKVEISEKSEAEIPVFNVSFLADSEAITPKNVDEEKAEIPESNIPQFINTWQSWLKIDRTEKPIEIQQKIKAEAIEKFIENEPKISQLKEEVNFVVKEKSSDISHLMTETLANIYVEQRLYSKAINAYEILKEKHPEKTDFFDDKIQEIKDLRTNGSK